MKQNGNNEVLKDYYIGLDVGTNSVGWAVADYDYRLGRFHGKDMWGARLFDEANDASERRTARTNRRRIARRKWRLSLLEMLFSEEITKVDPQFFHRLHESFLLPEDKSDNSSVFTLFADAAYTDKDYAKQYPSIYHLRSDLIHSKEPHDIRLVYLALHHLIKSRGHFLYENSGDGSGKTLQEALADLQNVLNEREISFIPENEEAFLAVLQSDNTLTEKKKAIKEAYKDTIIDNEEINIQVLLELLTGATVQLSKLFCDDELKNAEIAKLSLQDDLESKLDELGGILEDRLEIVRAAKDLYDVARLGKILGKNEYICDAKIELYKKNQKDIRILKAFIKKNYTDDYKHVFNAQSGVKNFAAYMRYKTEEKCTQDEFCSFLKTYVKEMESSENPDEQRIYQEVTAKSFLTKLKGTDNGLIPYQLQLKELDAIMANASKYLPFLENKDENDITVKEKIRSIFTFRIPYYVGPLNPKSPNAWLVRSDEKIYPWNFSNVVDEKQSSVRFMENLIGRCTYTGEPVLPMDSLLYSRFMVLNEINTIKVNGNPIPVETKQAIYQDLFEDSKKKVRKKTIYQYLLSNNLISKNDEISGIDDNVKSSLKSYHDVKWLLDKTGDFGQTEDIIKSILVFGDNKKMLKIWLKDHTEGLSDSDMKRIQNLKYSEWGRLSEEFLTKIYTPNEDGEPMSIMDMLWNTNDNLMQLLSDKYQFAENAKAYKDEHYPSSESLHDRLDELYIAPAVRRSIWQTVRIVDELTDIKKGAPSKIFIEMARGSKEEMKNVRTASRKMQLLELYRSCKTQEKELYEKLENETDQTLRRDKLYLYYLQMGRCMYSGDPIDLDKLLNDNETYDIDHIYPRSRIKDNSLNNRVLVKSTLNREKTNTYPISDSIRNKMHDFWTMLYQKQLITAEKYNRLVRSSALTEDELASFVQRQLVETQQSTKALAETLKGLYPNTKIVYSKAGNVSEFRQTYNFIKCREINDLHHAKDAYLNIVVGNTYDTKFTEQFFKNILAENYSLNRVFSFTTPGAWNADGSSIAIVKKYMKKNTPIVTFMPVEYKGAISKLQILPKKQGQLPIKKGLAIEKYGGYTEIKGSYFCVVEHGKGKKRIRTVEPVYYYRKALYEQDPIKYCTEILELENPRIICAKILINTVIELNGSRLAITGRTGNRYIYKHTYQFAVDDDHAKYIKELGKYIERCDASNCVFEKGEYVNASENRILYQWLISRLSSNVYNKLNPLKNVMKDLSDCVDKFESLNLYDQAKLLLEVLYTFKCNSVWTSLKTLNNKGRVGILLFSKNLSSLESACIVHQSVTGLYEVKEDLLK